VIGRSARVAPSVVFAIVAVTAFAALTILVVGCGPTPAPSNPAASATGSLAPASTAEGPSPSAGAESPPRSDPASPGAAVQVDPGLLVFVPSTVEGVPLTFDPETSATIAADPSVAADATGLAVALAALPGSSGADDLAIVSVVRLRDPAGDESWFRDWRETYDEAACGQAGGVIGNAEAQLGGGTVHIGSCSGGVLTYHTRIEQAGIVVSVTALGSRRLGEKVMAGIQR
jgi:hypothetical protein